MKDYSTSNTASCLASITFPFAEEGWVCGENAIRHYTSGTWTADQSYASGGYNSIYFVPGTTQGWCVGDTGRILHTTNGTNWADLSDKINAVATDCGFGSTDYSDVFFINDNGGWVTSSCVAEIYHTTDGGETFEVQTTEYHCNAIHMLNANEGYAGGASGRVYRTIDGGENWIAIGSMGTTLADISFPSTGNTGYCCGINGNIWSIDSNGVTKMTSGVPDSLDAISFPINSDEGWVCGGSIIRHYTNGAWVGDQFRPSGGYNAIYFVDSQNGWAVGDNGIIIHTEDGQNWVTQQTNSAYILTDVFFMNTQEGWAVGTGGGIFHTTNGGTNWNIEGGLTTAFLRGVHFTSPTNGYICGNEGTLLKYVGEE